MATWWAPGAKGQPCPREASASGSWRPSQPHAVLAEEGPCLSGTSPAGWAGATAPCARSRLVATRSGHCAPKSRAEDAWELVLRLSDDRVGTTEALSARSHSPEGNRELQTLLAHPQA